MFHIPSTVMVLGLAFYLTIFKPVGIYWSFVYIIMRALLHGSLVKAVEYLSDLLSSDLVLVAKFPSSIY